MISFRDNKFAQPDRLVYFIRQHGQAAKVRPDMKVVFFQNWETPEERLMVSPKSCASLPISRRIARRRNGYHDAARAFSFKRLRSDATVIGC